MKKIFCTLILGLVIAAGALAQETDSAQSGGNQSMSATASDLESTRDTTARTFIQD